MDSRLLLNLASHDLVKLELDWPAFAFPGMAEFLRASHSLRFLELKCNQDMLTCAEAELIMSSCQGLKVLICRGWFIPHTIPASVTALDVCFRPWSSLGHQAGCPTGQVKALLFRLARTPGLERLWLRLWWNPQLPALPSLRLHQLRDVRLEFSVTDGPLDIKWLQGQSIDELHLKITVCVASLKAHRKLVKQLQALTIHFLDVDVHADVELKAQALWGCLVVQQELWFTVHEGQSLTALPQCKWRKVGGEAASAKPFQIHWYALASCAGWIRIDADKAGTMIEVVGCPGYAPGYSDPWQLCFRNYKRTFVGLTAPGVQKGSCVVQQNLAAKSAGWLTGDFWASQTWKGWR